MIFDFGAHHYQNQKCCLNFSCS